MNSEMWYTLMPISTLKNGAQKLAGYSDHFKITSQYVNSEMCDSQCL